MKRIMGFPLMPGVKSKILKRSILSYKWRTPTANPEAVVIQPKKGTTDQSGFRCRNGVLEKHSVGWDCEESEIASFQLSTSWEYPWLPRGDALPEGSGATHNLSFPLMWNFFLDLQDSFFFPPNVSISSGSKLHTQQHASFFSLNNSRNQESAGSW